jgi:hypothetical protein
MLSVFVPWRTWIGRHSTLATCFFALWIFAFWNNPHTTAKSFFWLKMYAGLGFIAACGICKMLGINNRKAQRELLIALSSVGFFCIQDGLSVCAGCLIGLWFGYSASLSLLKFGYDTKRVIRKFQTTIHKNTHEALYGNKSCLGETKYRFVLPPWKTTNQLRLEGLGIALLSILFWSTFFVLIALWALK